MKTLLARIGFALVLAASLTLIGAHFGVASTAAVEREVAVTFDDLPSSSSHDVATLRKITERLVQTLKSNRVPVTAFVNEQKLYQNQTEERIAILKMWVDAGFDLGNHTYSHMRLYNASLEEHERGCHQG